jgi:hypothetical protein
MEDSKASDQRIFVAGVCGINAMLLIAMAYAAWDSGKHYDEVQIQRTITDQSTR